MSDQAAANRPISGPSVAPLGSRTGECAPLLVLPAFSDLLGFLGLADADLCGNSEGAI
jgi:hypothetical protein